MNSATITPAAEASQVNPAIRQFLTHCFDVKQLQAIASATQQRIRAVTEQEEKREWDRWTQGFKKGATVYALKEWSTGTFSDPFAFKVKAGDAFIVYHIKPRARVMWLISAAVETPRTNNELKRLQDSHRLFAVTPGRYSLNAYSLTPPLKAGA